MLRENNKNGQKWAISGIRASGVPKNHNFKFWKHNCHFITYLWKIRPKLKNALASKVLFYFGTQNVIPTNSIRAVCNIDNLTWVLSKTANLCKICEFTYFKWSTFLAYLRFQPLSYCSILKNIVQLVNLIRKFLTN